MTLNDNQLKELKTSINEALDLLYDTDILLIERHANEQSISFRFGLYLTDTISETSFARDNDLTIDVEYNRNGEAAKEMELLNIHRRIKPDLIFHHRGFNDKNVLVVEFKGYWNRDSRDNDINKLRGFTHPNENDYQYGLGAFVELLPIRNQCQISYFINGEVQQ